VPILEEQVFSVKGEVSIKPVCRFVRKPALWVPVNRNFCFLPETQNTIAGEKHTAQGKGLSFAPAHLTGLALTDLKPGKAGFYFSGRQYGSGGAISDPACFQPLQTGRLRLIRVSGPVPADQLHQALHRVL
jgi:hypothetical protein